jgi:hypothetical protein
MLPPRYGVMGYGEQATPDAGVSGQRPEQVRIGKNRGAEGGLILSRWMHESR